MSWLGVPVPAGEAFNELLQSKYYGKQYARRVPVRGAHNPVVRVHIVMWCGVVLLALFEHGRMRAALREATDTARPVHPHGAASTRPLSKLR